MCGIVGFCEPDPARPVDEHLLRAATHSLAHRGPDGEGLLVRGSIGLGHRRLSIIDVGGGAQPIFNEDGTVGVVFNGEIYNYIEVRDELIREGHRFTTSSDTEVIVHAYEQYGPDCLERFTGMFAFAVWDGRDRSVFVARDRLGKKPLFYRHHHGRLAFASELKALLHDPSLPRQLDVDALDDYLAYSYVPTDRCILRGVEKLAPGHWMRWKDGRLTIRKYWDVLFDEQPRLSDDEWGERIEEELRRAVRLRLRSDVPLGIFLSGGVDSSTVTALASQELGGAVKTFSVNFREAGFDDSQFARLVADRYHTDHHEITVEDRGIDILADVAYHLDEPFGDPSALPTYYVCREAARHVKVCLSGDGADELLAGYSRYRLARKYRRYDRVPAPVRQAVGSLALAAMPAHVWGRGAIERFTASGLTRYFLQTSTFGLEERTALLSGHLEHRACAGPRWFERHFRPLGHDLVTALQHLDQKTYLVDDILVKVDRMSMQSSLEVRVPFLDHHVVETANAAPARLKLKGGCGKYILKKAMSPHLPPEVLQRSKLGFGVPIRHWFRGSLHDYARDWLLGEGSRSTAFLARGQMEQILRQHTAGMRDFSEKIWALLMFEHWCRRYRVSR
jgi:asparagine synthase (glutamine-hydrolysing)